MAESQKAGCYYFVVAALIGACLFPIGHSGVVRAQDDVFTPAHPWLVVRAVSANPRTGTTRVTASCRQGELLLGGYRTDRPALDAPRYPSFEASYPSGSRSWTVVVYFPGDAQLAKFGSKIVVEAYCLTKPIARVQIVSSPRVRAVPDQVGRFFISTSRVSCPSGAVLTAGGFRTTRTVPHAGHYNAWISRSLPTGSAGRATGWRVDVDAIQWTRPPDAPTTRAYAVCASPAVSSAGVAAETTARQRVFRTVPIVSVGTITAGTIASRSLPAASIARFNYFEGQAACAAGQVAVGGGYEVVGTHDITDQSRMVPHNVYWTTVAAVGGGPAVLAKPPARGPAPSQRMPVPAPSQRKLAPPAPARPNPFGGWRTGGIHGGAPGGLTAHVPCIKLPQVALTVQIISPKEGSATELAFRDGRYTGRTLPIGFRAIAGDGFGNYVSDATFTWFVEGQPLGSGEAFTADLPAQRCSVENRTVRVTAKDKRGNSATDEVKILVGGIC